MSVADIAVVPLPDVLGLDSAARMNTPGTACGNWSWRLERDGLTDASCARLRLMTDVSGRLARDRSVVPPVSG
jgi:4-alpha-glucanotransferase